MRDTVSETLFIALYKQESKDGLIYFQFYKLIKTPFNLLKVYVFNNNFIENLALDLKYITFSKAVYEFSYLYSKKRAYANLVDNRGKLYRIREEHRISLIIMEEIY
jgi:hypothetical protein